ncbi:polymer-forming cytoskeletal protein, partial [bacterium]
MKNLTKWLIFASLVVVIFALPARVNAQTPTGTTISADNGGKVVFGTAYTLSGGETLDGNLVIFGGSATVEQDATVKGDIAIFGGTLSVSGHVTGSINALGGSVNLNETAVIDGDVQTMG